MSKFELLIKTTESVFKMFQFQFLTNLTGHLWESLQYRTMNSYGWWLQTWEKLGKFRDLIFYLGFGINFWHLLLTVKHPFEMVPRALQILALKQHLLCVLFMVTGLVLFYALNFSDTNFPNPDITPNQHTE